MDEVTDGVSDEVVTGVFEDVTLEEFIEDITLEDVSSEETTEDTIFEVVGASDEVVFSVFDEAVSLDEVVAKELESDILLCVLYWRTTDEFPSVSSSSTQPKRPTSIIIHNSINSILFIIPPPML